MADSLINFEFTDDDKLLRREYLRTKNEQRKDEIWFAIWDKYAPRNCKNIPTTMSKKAFALADKIDAFLGII